MFLFLDHVQLIQVLYGILCIFVLLCPVLLCVCMLLCPCLRIIIVCVCACRYVKWEQHNVVDIEVQMERMEDGGLKDFAKGKLF